MPCFTSDLFHMILEAVSAITFAAVAVAFTTADAVETDIFSSSLITSFAFLFLTLTMTRRIFSDIILNQVVRFSICVL